MPHFRLTLAALALLAAGALHAQEPLPPDTPAAVDGVIGNSVLQLRYLAPAPFGGLRGDLDYGLLLSENREFILSAAALFDTELNIIPRLTLKIGPQAYAALLQGSQKTDVFALSLGASARYELIPSIGLAAFGSAFYSPGVLTFGNAHNLYDFIAGGELRFTRNLVGQAGYRWLKFTLVGQSDDKVANEIFAGLSYRLH